MRSILFLNKRYRQGSGKFLPEDIDAKLCTHIVYGKILLTIDFYQIQNILVYLKI